MLIWSIVLSIVGIAVVFFAGVSTLIAWGSCFVLAFEDEPEALESTNRLFWLSLAATGGGVVCALVGAGLGIAYWLS